MNYEWSTTYAISSPSFVSINKFSFSSVFIDWRVQRATMELCTCKFQYIWHCNWVNPYFVAACRHEKCALRTFELAYRVKLHLMIHYIVVGADIDYKVCAVFIETVDT